MEWLLAVATGMKLLVYNWTDLEAELGQEAGHYRLCHLLSPCAHGGGVLTSNHGRCIYKTDQDQARAVPGPGEVHKVGVPV